MSSRVSVRVMPKLHLFDLLWICCTYYLLTCTCRLMDRQLVSFVHIVAAYAIISAIIGVLEAVNRSRVHNFCWEIIPSIDHSLAEEMFPCV